jgi:hypothetical protein
MKGNHFNSSVLGVKVLHSVVLEVMIEMPLNCISLAWSIWNELVMCGVHFYLGGFPYVIFYFTAYTSSALQTDLCWSTCISDVAQLVGDNRDFPGALWSA